MDKLKATDDPAYGPQNVRALRDKPEHGKYAATKDLLLGPIEDADSYAWFVVSDSQGSGLFISVLTLMAFVGGLLFLALSREIRRTSLKTDGSRRCLLEWARQVYTHVICQAVIFVLNIIFI